MQYGTLNNLNNLGGFDVGGGTTTVPFNPNSIPGLTLWFDATKNVYSNAGTTPAVDGGSVAQWNDQSATGNNLSQSTALNQPVYHTNAQNGLPIITGDGVNQFMQTSLMTFPQPAHVFMAVNVINWVANNCVIDGRNESSIQFRQNTGTPQVGIFAGLTIVGNVSPTLNTFNVLEGLFSGASSFIRLNNNSKSSVSSPGTGSPGGLTIMARGLPDLDRKPNESMGEILIYNVALSDSDAANVSRYLGTKWGITVS